MYSCLSNKWGSMYISILKINRHFPTHCLIKFYDEKIPNKCLSSEKCSSCLSQLNFWKSKDSSCYLMHHCTYLKGKCEYEIEKKNKFLFSSV